MRKSVLFMAFLSLGLSTALTGCYGTFPLIRKAYAFNKSVSPNKFVQEAVFLVMTVIPVYGVAGAADALILNSIEFWTGKAPTIGATHVESKDGATAAAKILDDGALELTVTDARGKSETAILVREADGVSARSLDGAFLGKVADASTGMVLITPKAN